MQSALDEAIKAAGGVTRLGQLLGSVQGTVSNWRQRGVPLDRCADIERVTGVRCEALRPDVEWCRDAHGQVTHYRVPVATQPAPSDQQAA